MEKAKRRRTAAPGATGGRDAPGMDAAGSPDGQASTSAVAATDGQAASRDGASAWSGSAAAPQGSGDALRALWSGGGAAGLAALDLTGQEQAACDLVQHDFDPSYYLLTNQDVCSAAIEPLHHYLRSGRLEGRRPAHWFDPAYYRNAYPEVDDLGCDPFSYFVQSGRAQGHATYRRNGPARRALDAARPPASRQPGDGPGTVMHLHPNILLQEMRARLSGARGLTVALSHDQYLRNVGGIQILVASEQAAFNARGEAYLHLAPALPLMTLAPDGPDPYYLHLTMDGVHLGAATGAELLQALASLAPELPELRRLVVHCLFGHSTGLLVDMHTRLHTAQAGAPAAVFWVHDYETICVGYNLLRNDVAFCDAPPVGSPACTVCVYGAERPAHLAAVHALFHAIPFHVVAPSAAALALWERKAGLPHLSATVGTVLRTDATATRRQVGAAAERGSPGNRACIAFVGHPVVHKGWEAFVQVAAELQRSSAYRMLHFSSCSGRHLPGVEHVPVCVSLAVPDAMTAALSEAGVDLVLVLSPWPETFCIVASEALAAGADVLTLECSGNVANLVRQTGRGRVFAAADDVAAYLTSVQAMLDIRSRHEAGAEVGRVRLLGATAALALPGGDPEPAGAAGGIATPAGAA